MIFIQLVSSYSGSHGPILGPYKTIEFDWSYIRLFDGVSRGCDCIYWWESEGGYYYNGTIYKLYTIAEDLRDLKHYKSNFQIFDQSKAEKDEG